MTDSQDLYQQDMQAIIDLFDAISIEEKTEKKQIEILGDLPDLIKTLSADNFVSNFTQAARPGVENFLDTGTVDTTDFSTDDYFRNIKQALDESHSKINEIYKEYYTWVSRQTNNTVEIDEKVDIKSELDALNANFPYDPANKRWAFPSFSFEYQGETIVLPDLHFTLNFEQKRVTSAVRVVPGSNAVYSKNDEGFFHPHVDRSQVLCFGEAETPAQLFWERKELLPLAMILSATLATYNSGSPHCELRYWSSDNYLDCTECGRSIARRDAYFIDDEPGCEQCTKWVPDKDRRYWVDQVIYSDFAGDYILESEGHEVTDKHGNLIMVGTYIRDKYFVKCADCNTWHQDNGNRNLHEISGHEGIFCGECYSKRTESGLEEAA